MHRRFTTFVRILHTGAVNFIRNISLAIAAMAVMVVTLTILLFSLIANASFENTIAQITDKVTVSVYLKDATTDAQAQTLVAQLQKQPEVKHVNYLNKQQALQAFIKQNQGNESLLAATTEADNQIPPTIQVFPRNLNQVPAIKNFLVKPDNKALQTAESPSYSGVHKEAIDNITHATNILRKIGAASVIIFAVICVLIIFNTIQMAIFNRRDEITIMRLLGASTMYIRGPFIVESIIYGILSGVLSILIINSAFLASTNALQATALGLLDINYASDYFASHFWQFLTLQMGIGTLIGAASSIIATRRYLKFKTPKK